MTHHTPAVSINTPIIGAYERTLFNTVTGAELSHTTKNVVIGRVTESRPQSVHTPRSRDGTYHQAAAWNHSGGRTRVETYVFKRSGTIGDIRSSEGGEWLPAPVTTPDVQKVTDRAVQKALSGLGDNVRQMNVFFREAQEVIGLTKQFGNGLQKGLHGLIDLTANSWVARRDMRNFIRHGWKEAPSFYLGYIFGVAPLADDVANAVSALNDLVASDETFSLVVRGVHVARDQYDVQLKPDVGDIRYWLPLRREWKGRATLRFEVPCSKLGALEFITPFSTAYETTRLSFVLDYFLPIGPWLAGIEGCQIAPFFRDGTWSCKVTDTVAGKGRVVASPQPSTYRVEGTGEVVSYQRNRFNGFPYEAVFRPPSFKLPGLKQLGVLGALIGQRLTTLSKIIKQP